MAISTCFIATGDNFAVGGGPDHHIGGGQITGIVLVGDLVDLQLQMRLLVAYRHILLLVVRDVFVELTGDGIGFGKQCKPFVFGIFERFFGFFVGDFLLFKLLLLQFEQAALGFDRSQFVFDACQHILVAVVHKLGHFFIDQKRRIAVGAEDDLNGGHTAVLGQRLHTFLQGGVPFEYLLAKYQDILFLRH